MHERTAAVAPLQAKSRKIFTDQQLANVVHLRRCRARRLNHRGLTTFQERTYRTVNRIVLSCGGVCDWAVRRLAAACGISRAQFFKDMKVITGLGLIVREQRRGTGRHLDTNLWTLPQLAGVGGSLTQATEKQEFLKLNTNTNTQNLPVRPKARPAYSRQAENHPPEIRQRVEHNAKARHHRIERSHQHRPDASLGRYVPPTPEEAARRDAAWAAELAQMEQEWELIAAQRQAAEAQKQARAEQERIEREEAQRRERERLEALCPRCGGGGRREQITVLGTLRFVDCECGAAKCNLLKNVGGQE